MRPILFLTIISIIACKTESSDSVTINSSADSATSLNINTNITYARNLQGLINKNYPITMQLIIKGSQIQGSYFYDEIEELLPIKGSLSKNGFVQLAVYDITTETTEYFQGEFTENDGFIGQWFKAEAGAERMRVELSPSEFEPDFTTSDLKGMYAYVSGELISTIAIDTTEHDKVHFQTILSYVSCTGDVEGYAWYNTPSSAVFYGEDQCYLLFDLSKKTIWIQEGDCQYYHGFRCEFSGQYERASNEVEWIDLENLAF